MMALQATPIRTIGRYVLMFSLTIPLGTNIAFRNATIKMWHGTKPLLILLTGSNGVIIHVTAQDIEEAGHKARDNPITRAMQRETQQQWIVFDGYTAHELSLPYRSVKLPEPVAAHWQQYRETGLMPPFEFEFAALLPGIKPALPATPNALSTNPIMVKRDPAPTPAVAQTEDAVRCQQRRERCQQDRRLTDRRHQERRHYAERRHVQRAEATS